MAKQAIDLSTEDKIKAAARKLFTNKGFAATRTRDIAEEAGMNLALLNYYFRSKQKLFEIVMAENLQQFLSGLQTILYDTTTTLDEKIDHLVNFYIDMVIANPDLPLFVINELKANSKLIKSKVTKQMMNKSPFLQQVTEELIANKKTNFNPLNIVINTFSMIIFPFVAKPIIMQAGVSGAEEFAGIMNERRKMIPVWVKAMIRNK